MDRESHSDAHQDYIKRYLLAIEHAKEKRGEKNVRDEDIAIAVGVERETVTNWRRRGMPQKYIPKFSEFTGINEEWLAFNKGPMIGKETLPPDAQEMLDLYLKRDEAERAALLTIMRSKLG